MANFFEQPPAYHSEAHEDIRELEAELLREIQLDVTVRRQTLARRMKMGKLLIRLQTKIGVSWEDYMRRNIPVPRRTVFRWMALARKPLDPSIMSVEEADDLEIKVAKDVDEPVPIGTKNDIVTGQNKDLGKSTWKMCRDHRYAQAPTQRGDCKFCDGLNPEDEDEEASTEADTNQTSGKTTAKRKKQGGWMPPREPGDEPLNARQIALARRQHAIDLQIDDMARSLQIDAKTLCASRERYKAAHDYTSEKLATAGPKQYPKPDKGTCKFCGVAGLWVSTKKHKRVLLVEGRKGKWDIIDNVATKTGLGPYKLHFLNCKKRTDAE